MGITDSFGDVVESGKNLVNEGLSVAEETVEDGKEVLGRGIDISTGWTGDGLESLGFEGAADRVEDWGDETASSLGAKVDEQQLGQTEEANELVHGSPADITSTAKHLRDFQGAFERVGRGMRKLDSSHWKGEAANAFRDKFAMHPTKWLRAADACEKAAMALDSYADTVKWAQQQAQDAIDTYRKGQDASEKAEKADDPPDKDPGDAHRERAHEILNEARRQRNSAAETAERTVKAALAHAPSEPPPLDRATSTVMDAHGAAAVELNHVIGGVVKGGAGVLNFARGLNPTDPYNLTHPAQYGQNVNMTLAGLVSTAAHPERIPQALYESFKKDPSEAIGRLIPELIGTKGAGSLRTGVRVAAREGTEAGAESAARNAARHGPDAPKNWNDLAQATKDVKEKAVHADSVSPQKAQEFLDDQYPWLRDVNNTGRPGYTDNCTHNVVTVDKRLDGHEVSAAPKPRPDHLPPEALGLKNRAVGHYDMVKSYDDLIKDLNSRGDDARSVVYVSRPNNTAHVFNAVKTDHGVVFLDGQSGTLAKLERDVTSIGHIPYR